MKIKKKCINIYEALKNDGVFYNADVIKANSPYNKKLNDKMNEKYMQKHGLTTDEMNDHKQKKEDNDIPITLIKHLKLLEEVGFEEIDVIWKHYTNAVYGGTRK